MIRKFEKYATFQCLRQLYQWYMSGVKRLESNDFYVGWYIYIDTRCYN